MILFTARKTHEVNTARMLYNKYNTKKGVSAMKICDVIKWDMINQNDVFVYKAPEEDFNYLTQLIVHESQEAIFFMNGQALDSFGPGRYTLETQNLPLISKAINRLTGDKNPFHCEVYFINKTQQMAIKWGTDSKIQYIEPKYNLPLEIGMSGEMSVSVDNARKLLIKLVGTDKTFTRETLTQYLRSILNSKVKPYVAQYMKNNAVSIFEIDQHIETFSNELKIKLSEDYEDYGLNLDRFMVTTIAKPDGEKQYEDFKQLFYAQYADIARAKLEQEKAIINAETKAKETVIISEAEAIKRKQEGYTYQDERGFNVADKLAENQAQGQFTNIGVGLGTAAGLGATMAGVVGNAVKGAFNSNDANVCPNCGTKLTPGSKFCNQCGNKVGE